MTFGRVSSAALPLLCAAGLSGVLLAGAWPGSARVPRPQPTDSQAVRIEVVTAVAPDTVRVGESVVLGVTVRARDVQSVGFPALLPLADPLEQKGALEQDVREEGEWRAYYRVVAWKVGEQRIPAFDVSVRGADGEQRVGVTSVPFEVVSILPADTAGLELREARPFLRITGLPWAWMLLLLLGGAAFLYWLRQRRVQAALAAAPPPPFERALESLRVLRQGWQEGRLTAPELFDGLESALRGYVEATRSWRPGASLLRLTDGDRALAAALRHSVLVRFARVMPPGDTPLASIEAGESWLLADARRGEDTG